MSASVVGAGQGAGDVLRGACAPWHSASENRHGPCLRQGSGWLAKRQGGAGGSHVVTSHIVTSQAATRRTGTGGRAARPHLFQEKVEGRPVSALFAGTGTSARVLGFSEQWAAPTSRAKWRYGGAARPAELSRDLEARLTDDVERVAQCFALRGLGSADFLVNGDEARLLEINPRPGATLDIFDSEAEPLLRIHLEAVLDNRLPTALRNLPAATASAIVYATEPITVSQTMIWPDWTADQPGIGERIDKDRPICTVWARSRTKVEARRLVEERSSIAFWPPALAEKEGRSGRDERGNPKGTERNQVAERQSGGRASRRRLDPRRSGLAGRRVAGAARGDPHRLRRARRRRVGSRPPHRRDLPRRPRARVARNR